MRTRFRPVLATLLLAMTALTSGPEVDAVMVAKIREEGLQRSRVMDIAGYMTDVLGARLTVSEDMSRAQAWVQDEMRRIGFVNVPAEPFMDFGVTWDNTFTSLHMVAPDYQPMVATRWRTRRVPLAARWSKP